MYVLGIGLALVAGCTEEAGPKLRRECTSLVNTVLEQDQTVPTDDLWRELQKRGLTPLPPRSYPTAPIRPRDIEDWLTPSRSPAAREYAAAEEKYKVAVKEYDTKWEEAKGTPVYREAWKTIFAQKTEKAVNECIRKKATDMGVTVE